MSPLESLFDILASPRKVFGFLRTSPRWGLALGVYFTFKLLTVYTLIPLSQESTEPALRTTLTQRGLSEEVIDGVVESQFHGSLRVLSSISEAAKGTAGVVLLGTMLWIAVAVRTRARRTFVKELALVSYASVPLTLGNLLLVAFALQGLPNYFNPAVSLQWMTSHIFLLGLASFLDPFNLWMMSLVVLGNAEVFSLRGPWGSARLLGAPAAAYVVGIALLSWLSAQP
jgi:hypothetical protein